MASRMIRVAAGCLAALVASLALAPAVAAETTVEVGTPAGEYVQGSASQIPLLVTVSADGAVEGDIVVTLDGQTLAVQPVEVPGGSSKTVVVPVTSIPWSNNYSVRFETDDEDDSATARFTSRTAGGDEIVAVLPRPAARGLPDTADLGVDIGRARLFAFEPALLDDGWRMLAVFGQAVAEPADLTELAGDQADALWRWVGDGGGTLLVTGEPDATLLPDRLDAVAAPADPTTFAVGLGNVRFLGDTLDRGWDGVIEPRPAGSISGEFFGESFPTIMQLGRDAGIKVPGIGVLLIALVAYALVAGPLLWVLLRRRRREPVIWLAVPLLAVLVTGVVYVVGRQLRESASVAHATLHVDSPGVTTIATQVLVTSPNGGRTGVQETEGWRATPPNPFDGGWFAFEGDVGFGGRPGIVASGGSGQRDPFTVNLDPGGFGIVRLETSSARDAGPTLAITTAPTGEDGDEVAVTVTNETAYDLVEVFVTTSGGLARIGDLAAGETAEVELGTVRRLGFQPDPIYDALARNDPWSPNDGPTNPGIVMEHLNTNPQLRRDGQVIAVGWTRDAPAPVATRSGDPIDIGRTAFMSVERIDPAAVGAARVSVLRGFDTSRATTDRVPPAICSDGTLTMQVAPSGPLGPDDSPVLAVSSRSVAALDVWDGAEWVPAGMSELGDDPVIELPADAVAGGEAFVRLATTCEGMGRGDAALPALRSATPDDTTVALGLPDDEAAADDEEAEG